MMPEMVSAKKVPSRVGWALDIFPDFRMTRMGPYKRNLWTDFAEQKLLFRQEMSRGLTTKSYQSWLDINFRMFKILWPSRQNPVSVRVYDLARDNGDIPVLWSLSFGSKGFDIRDNFTIGTVKLRTLKTVKDNETLTVERELFRDMFGESVIVERVYGTNNELEIITTCTPEVPGSKKLIMRVDDPELPGYSQWYSDYLVGATHEVPALFGVDELIFPFVSRDRLIIRIYDNQTLVPRT